MWIVRIFNYDDDTWELWDTYDSHAEALEAAVDLRSDGCNAAVVWSDEE